MMDGIRRAHLDLLSSHPAKSSRRVAGAEYIDLAVSASRHFLVMDCALITAEHIPRQCGIMPRATYSVSARATNAQIFC